MVSGAGAELPRQLAPCPAWEGQTSWCSSGVGSVGTLWPTAGLGGGGAKPIPVAVH